MGWGPRPRRPATQRYWPDPDEGGVAAPARVAQPAVRTGSGSGTDQAELARLVAELLPREPAARREDPFARVREARRAASVDVDRVVTTVQRALARQAAVDRERRGVPR
ncbi:MAG: hypothetical protein ABSA53_05575 [Streptosporangiaceae bacterium]